MEIFSFVAQVFRDLTTAGPLEQLGFVLTVLSLPAVSWFLLIFRGRNTRRLVDELRRDAAALAVERDLAEHRADAAQANAARWNPASWMDAAHVERAHGNEERAIAILGDGFERLREGLANTSLALAGHHLSLIVGTDPGENLAEGERFAMLAQLLNPGDRDAAFLVEEAATMKALGPDALSAVPISFLPSNQQEAIAAIEAIQNLATQYASAGQVRITLRLLRRASLIAGRAGLVNDEIGLSVSHDVAVALWACGNYDEARSETEALVPAVTRVLGHDSEMALNLKALHLRVLYSQGEHKYALDKIETLLPIMCRALGYEHTSVLVVRMMKAEALTLLCEHLESLKEVESLILDQGRVLGPEHPHTHISRGLHIQLLSRLGRFREALDSSEELLATLERIHGSGHPRLFMVRAAEIDALNNFGEHERANAKAGPLLADAELSMGAAHPDILVLRSTQVNILRCLGEYEDALEAVQMLLSDQEKILSPGHVGIIQSRILRAQVLLDLSHFDAALAEALTLSRLAQDALGDHVVVGVARCLEAEASIHLQNPTESLRALQEIIEAYSPYFVRNGLALLQMRYARLVAFEALGDRESGIEEALGIISVLEQDYSPQHYLLLRTRALKARMEAV